MGYLLVISAASIESTDANKDQVANHEDLARLFHNSEVCIVRVGEQYVQRLFNTSVQVVKHNEK